MAASDGDARYAASPIEIARRPPTESPSEPAPLAQRVESPSERAVSSREPASEPVPEAVAPEAVAPPAHADPATPPQAAKAIDEHAEGSGESEPPAAPGGSVTPTGDPPPERPWEVRIPILGEEVFGKNLAFVIDRSASMAPVWIGVRTELDATLRLLTPDHQFSLVLYSNELNVWNEGWTRGTPDMIERAIAWTEAVPARGATDPEPAIEHALRLKGLDALILMSDIRFHGARMDRTVELLTKATRGTKTFKAIKLYFFPLEENEATRRISALSSGSPGAAFKLRNLRK
jgi:hypothetical protein